mmetsp:Transcript_25619/g.71585  ORF Transcript_25619/g.71585 Transcript_25619/m.71585 type:complete len:214 (+) Transcript_25619:2368-3009(+)
MSSLGSLSRSTRVDTLYPPCMVPSSSMARSRGNRSWVSAPVANAESQVALTYAASSTPGGTRCTRSSCRRSELAEPAFRSSMARLAWLASNGFGATPNPLPMAARSATWASYSSKKPLDDKDRVVVDEAANPRRAWRRPAFAMREDSMMVAMAVLQCYVLWMRRRQRVVEMRDPVGWFGLLIRVLVVQHKAPSKNENKCVFCCDCRRRRCQYF